MTPTAWLQHTLVQRLDASAAAWLHGAMACLGSDGSGGSDRDLYRVVSLASRKLGKAPLQLTAPEQADAAAARPGWNPAPWTMDQAARVLLLLLAAGNDGERFSTRLDALCATADVDELVAFYRGLPLYPDAPRHRARAAEGIRSNMRVVFEAVAHANPYPAEQLADEAWNQMVLKALFVGSALHPIVGLDQRANPALARMLGDYAHERWAAQRSINPELWRCVGTCAAGPLWADLAHVLDTGSAPERAAVVLALRQNTAPEAAALLARHAALLDAVAAQRIGWSTLMDFF
jgi:hypothetical protein